MLLALIEAVEDLPDGMQVLQDDRVPRVRLGWMHVEDGVNRASTE